MKKFPVQVVGSLERIAYAASAIISELLLLFAILSPPRIFRTAAVSIAVSGHNEFTPIENFEPYHIEEFNRFILCAKYYIPIKSFNNQFFLL